MNGLVVIAIIFGALLAVCFLVAFCMHVSRDKSDSAVVSGNSDSASVSVQPNTSRRTLQRRKFVIKVKKNQKLKRNLFHFIESAAYWHAGMSDDCNCCFMPYYVSSEARNSSPPRLAPSLAAQSIPISNEVRLQVNEGIPGSAHGGLPEVADLPPSYSKIVKDPQTNNFESKTITWQ